MVETQLKKLSQE